MTHDSFLSQAQAALVLSAALLAGGCVDTIETDRDERSLRPGPRAEFDPQGGVIPLPNVLLLDPESGRLQIPESCGETPAAAALRATLNRLDGFATSQPNVSATFNAPVDEATLDGRVFLVRLAERGEPLAAPEPPVPLEVSLRQTQRLGEDCTTTTDVTSLLLRPLEPLVESSIYGVFLLDGIRTETGSPFEPSVTWGIVRQAEAPVQIEESSAGPRIVRNNTPFDPASRGGLASLEGVLRLWQAHAPLLSAWDALAPVLAPNHAGRQDVLLAWSFPTQSVSRVLDRSVVGSPAATLRTVSDRLALPPALAGSGAPLSVEEFFANALPGADCAALGCAAIGGIYARSPASPPPSFVSPSYLGGDDCDAATDVALGAFSDPLDPALVCENELDLLLALPATEPPEGGYPTIVFGHGLGRSKEDLLALAGSFAAAGYASVALDAVDHGTRAVRVSESAALGCAEPGTGNTCSGAIAPTCAPQCYAPLLSANLELTRDHLRQTVLDTLQLERVLVACAKTEACGALRVDPERIGYVGHALGALLGTIGLAMSDGTSAGVLHEPAADWVSVLTTTETLAVRCPLVDALIESGVLEGEPWQGGANDDALCVDDDWLGEPRFLEFAAAARWLLDPVNPANYARRLRTRDGPRVLLAEIDGDPLIPNAATAELGALLELEPQTAAPATSAMPEPSAGAASGASAWLRYTALPADADTAFPGNAYGPGSLLAPAEPSPGMGDAAGLLGTVRLRVDTLTYLGAQP